MAEIESHPEHTELTIEFIQNLHRLVTRGVKGIQAPESTGRFREAGRMSFAFSASTFLRYTEEGVISLMAAISRNELPGAALFVYEDELTNICNPDGRTGEYLGKPGVKGIYAVHTLAQRDVTAIENVCGFGNPYDEDVQHFTGKILRANNGADFLFCIDHDFKIILVNNIDAKYLITRSERSRDKLAREILDRIWKNKVVYLAPYCKDSMPALTPFVQKILDNYNHQIIQAVNDDEKIECIGKTIEALERLHPFYDGNGRTFVNLLLNFLLIKSGFPPATFFDPNVFDAYGHTVDVIKRGISNTLRIYNGKRNLFGFRCGNHALNKLMKAMMQEADTREVDFILGNGSKQGFYSR